jgi:hypothetical protein
VDPPRRIRLDQTCDIGNGLVGRNANQKMYVILSSIDAESGAADLANDPAEIRVQILFEIGLD